MKERNLDLSIELVNNTMFRVEIYDPESGDHARTTFNDSDVAELKSFLADEILGWVNIMRDDEEAREAEEFARHEHDLAIREDIGDYDESNLLSYTEAWGDVLNYLEARPEEWYSERGRTKGCVLNDATLINAIVREHMKCVNRYGNDREWSVKDACNIDLGI